MCKAMGIRWLDEFNEWDLMKDTSPRMLKWPLKWSQEVYEQVQSMYEVQVQGEKVTKRRNVYPIC